MSYKFIVIQKYLKTLFLEHSIKSVETPQLNTFHCHRHHELRSHTSTGTADKDVNNVNIAVNLHIWLQNFQSPSFTVSVATA